MQRYATKKQLSSRLLAWPALAALLAGCASGHKYHDQKMDFASVRTVAVLPFANLSRDTLAAERVRDVFSGLLMATGSIYVLPQGEVAKGIGRAGLANPYSPAKDEVLALAKALGADAVFTGVLKEYGEVRSGSAAANTVSVSMSMYETSAATVVWTASTTQGGVGFADRLFGGGGAPMNKVTEEACRDLLDKLFK